MQRRYRNQNDNALSRFPDPFCDRRGSGPRRPREPISSANLSIPEHFDDNKIYYAWFGHSSVLVHMHGLNILVDPIFSRHSSPVPFVGPKRFPGRVIQPSELPEIDIVLITHNHYDHLDKPTILALDPQVKSYIAPEGVGRNLTGFGVSRQKITELNWHDQRNCNGLRIVCTPAQHNSARTLWDADKTLWCSYVLQDSAFTVYFSGDSGFSGHFQEIHDLYGDVDLAFMECGQYGELWHWIHMFPEESAEACRILHAKQSVPIHWGAYVLSLHPWDDPPKRFLKRSRELGLPCVIPVLNQLYEARSGPHASAGQDAAADEKI